MLYLVPMLDNAVDPTAFIGYANIASVFVGVFLPILVGLISRQGWSGAAKAWTLAALSAISGFLTEYITSSNSSNGDFHWQQALLTSLVTFVTAGAAYHNLWKPTGVTDRAQRAFNGSPSTDGATALRMTGLVAVVGAACGLVLLVILAG